MSESVITPEILSHFSHWASCDCWVMCNREKQPVTIHDGEYLIPSEKHPDAPYYYGMCTLLRWKAEPQDHITTLPIIKKAVDSFFGHFGFGIMLGLNNTVVCFDFDHCISDDGSIPEGIREFLDVISTFTEISSSGTGLHAFVAVEGNTEEYDFRKELCDGKCYDKRFIKLTGKVFEKYNLPLKIISEYEFQAIKNKLGNIRRVEPRTQKSDNFARSSAYTGGNNDWVNILTKEGIRFEVIPNYADKQRKHGDIERTSLWAAKIQCPNAESHTGYNSRRDQFNPDIAILTVWDDNTTSVKCNHNHCSAIYRPNLLLKLWTQIKQRRMARVTTLLSNWKVIK